MRKMLVALLLVGAVILVSCQGPAGPPGPMPGEEQLIPLIERVVQERSEELRGPQGPPGAQGPPVKEGAWVSRTEMEALDRRITELTGQVESLGRMVALLSSHIGATFKSVGAGELFLSSFSVENDIVDVKQWLGMPVFWAFYASSPAPKPAGAPVGGFYKSVLVLPGGEVVLSGWGFERGELVTLEGRWPIEGTTIEILKTVKAGKFGNFATRIRVPSGQTGQYVIFARGERGASVRTTNTISVLDIPRR